MFSNKQVEESLDVQCCEKSFTHKKKNFNAPSVATSKLGINPSFSYVYKLNETVPMRDTNTFAQTQML